MKEVLPKLLLYKHTLRNIYWIHFLPSYYSMGQEQNSEQVQNKNDRIPEGYILRIMQYTEVESNYPGVLNRNKLPIYLLKSKKDHLFILVFIGFSGIFSRSYFCCVYFFLVISVYHTHLFMCHISYNNSEGLSTQF